MLLDDFAVGLDARVPGDGGPFTGRGDEGNVDGWVCSQVIRLAGFGVCVEEEVEAVALLHTVISTMLCIDGGHEEMGSVPWQPEPCILKPTDQSRPSVWSTC